MENLIQIQYTSSVYDMHLYQYMVRGRFKNSTEMNPLIYNLLFSFAEGVKLNE